MIKGQDGVQLLCFIDSKTQNQADSIYSSNQLIRFVRPVLLIIKHQMTNLLQSRHPLTLRYRLQHHQ